MIQVKQPVPLEITYDPPGGAGSGITLPMPLRKRAGSPWEATGRPQRETREPKKDSRKTPGHLQLSACSAPPHRPPKRRPVQESTADTSHTVRQEALSAGSARAEESYHLCPQPPVHQMQKRHQMQQCTADASDTTPGERSAKSQMIPPCTCPPFARRRSVNK